MNIKVKVDVELGAGAKVSLTDAQMSEVKKMVVRLINGEVSEEVKVKKQYKPRKKSLHHWTAEERAEVLRLDNIPQGKARAYEIGKLSRKYGVSRDTISVMKSHLKKRIRDKANVSSAAPTQLHVKETTPAGSLWKRI